MQSDSCTTERAIASVGPTLLRTFVTIQAPGYGRSKRDINMKALARGPTPSKPPKEGVTCVVKVKTVCAQGRQLRSQIASKIHLAQDVLS